MSAIFQKSKLEKSPPKRVCLRLKEIRKEKGITLKIISKKTKINIDYIKAIEECRFDELNLSPIYLKNFIKKYAEALKIDPKTFISQYTEEEIKPEQGKIKHPKTFFKRYHLSNLPNILRYVVVSLAIFGLFFYLGIQIKKALEPPTLTIFSPKNGYITNESEIAVNGNTEPEVEISINGKKINSNKKGEFNEMIILNSGINKIIIIAQNKHGKITEEIRHIIYKKKEAGMK